MKKKAHNANSKKKTCFDAFASGQSFNYKSLTTYKYIVALDTIYFSHMYVYGISWNIIFQLHIRVWRLLIQYISATYTYMASLETIYFSHIYVCGVACYYIFQPHIRIWRLLILYVYFSHIYCTYLASLDTIYFCQDFALQSKINYTPVFALKFYQIHHQEFLRYTVQPT